MDLHKYMSNIKGFIACILIYNACLLKEIALHILGSEDASGVSDVEFPLTFTKQFDLLKIKLMIKAACSSYSRQTDAYGKSTGH